MYNKKTLTFTFHHYWGAFCQGAFCPRGAFVQGAFVPDPNICTLSQNINLFLCEAENQNLQSISSFSLPNANKFYILRQCMYILFILQH